MSSATFACARCATANHPSNRFCVRCDLPLGVPRPDAAAGLDALGPYEPPDPFEDEHVESAIRLLITRNGLEATPFGAGWRVVVPLELDRHQAVYVGAAGTDSEGRSLLGLVSVCGPATDRDARTLLQLNARAAEGHFAIKTLRGEAYFVVVHNVVVEAAGLLDAASLVLRIARLADGLEDRLSRGRDLF